MENSSSMKIQEGEKLVWAHRAGGTLWSIRGVCPKVGALLSLRSQDTLTGLQGKTKGLK